jgi:hypothetical protein
MNPSKQIYSVVMEYILSNTTIAGTFKAANIIRYDKPSNNRFPYKQELMPADLPELILQLNNVTPNRHSSGEYVEIYQFQATITTSAWNLDQSVVAHVLIDWLIDGNHNMMDGIDFGEGYEFYKIEVLPMQIANAMADKNRNLSGFVYGVFFNVQISRPRGV